MFVYIIYISKTYILLLHLYITTYFKEKYTTSLNTTPTLSRNNNNNNILICYSFFLLYLIYIFHKTITLYHKYILNQQL